MNNLISSYKVLSIRDLFFIFANMLLKHIFKIHACKTTFIVNLL